MNKQRRKVLEDCHQKLTVAAEEERECFENMPEGLQQSERGEMMEQTADELDEACALIEEILNR